MTTAGRACTWPSCTVDCENCGKEIKEEHYSWFAQVTVAEEQRSLGYG
jgi:hypothetical protein